MSSSLEDRLRYNPTDCFETFPFPGGYASSKILEQVGETYYQFRANLMIRNNEGLTETYNRFHRPDERSPEVIELRRLHEMMDRAVLDAYEWGNIGTTCEFFTEFDEEDEEAPSPSGRAKQVKHRYRWPEDIHDEVLARVLALNLERASQQAEPQQALHDLPPKATLTRKPKTRTEPLLF